ncbi:MAG: anthranilate phosphoribosyltransferase [Burkholderiales bacterium]|nr:anthranilate phosphoribosyltransferase [Bacteroidia bacterium]
MKTSFQMLCQGHNLSETEAYQLFQTICRNEFNAAQIAAIMAFYIARPITVNELTGFRKALLEVCIPVKLDREAIDVCGTGGDQKDTFNISTLSALVLAASGVPVAKHGNYGSSSVSGSSDILNHLGYKFKTNSDDLNREFNQHNICFMHAPLFHPALKTVAAQRKELAVKTFFNLLGPLVNPANISFRYVGVYGLEVARIYNYILQKDKADYCLVHSIDGYDEVSLTSSFKYITKKTEQTIEPETLGFALLKEQDIYGGKTIGQAATIFVNVLKNESTIPQKNVVVANSALAMNAYNPKQTIQECLSICKETIESKKTHILFKHLTSN